MPNPKNQPYGAAYRAPTGGETEGHAALGNVIRMRNDYGPGRTTLADFIRYFSFLRGQGVTLSAGAPPATLPTANPAGGFQPARQSTAGRVATGTRGDMLNSTPRAWQRIVSRNGTYY